MDEISEPKRNDRRRNFYITYFSSLVALTGVLGIFYTIMRDGNMSSTTQIIIAIFSSILTIAGLTALMANYLRVKPSDTRTNLDQESIVNEIRKQLEFLQYRDTEVNERNREYFEEIFKRLEKREDHSVNFDLSNSEKAKLFSNISGKISDNLTDEFFEELKKSIRIQQVETREKRFFEIARRSERAIERLRQEISILTRRANINLIIGSSITIAALILLGYFVLQENFNSPEILSVTLHFIPRLSLVVFIELFSFFFLKLYRASLGEIKYYQNELTNLELKQVAIELVNTSTNPEDLSFVMKELMSVERNFKLEKGESTVELEKDKLDSNDLKELLQAALNFTSNQSKDANK